MSRGGSDGKGKTFYDRMPEAEADKLTIKVYESQINQAEVCLRNAVLELNSALGIDDPREKKAVKSMGLLDLSAKLSGLASNLGGLYLASKAEHEKVRTILERVVESRTTYTGAIEAEYRIKFDKIVMDANERVIREMKNENL